MWVLASPLSSLFQNFLATGKLRRNLKVGKICPIHEVCCRAEAKHYGPFFLTSHISKVVERIVRRKLFPWGKWLADWVVFLQWHANGEWCSVRHCSGITTIHNGSHGFVFTHTDSHAHCLANVTKASRVTEYPEDDMHALRELDEIYKWTEKKSTQTNNEEFQALYYQLAKPCGIPMKHTGPGGIEIPERQSVRDLGIYMSNEASFDVHFAKLAMKCQPDS